MAQVSNLFKNKIYSSDRSIQAKVSFEILAVEAYEDASFTVSGEAPISRLSQAINKIREMSHKYATYETDYFRLDGTFYIPPKENEGDSELGWWSDVISDQDGIFTTNPTVTFTFTKPHSSIGLTFTFDNQANEYPSEFSVKTYSATDVLLVSQTITNNSSSIYYFDVPLDNYSKIVIEIIKWAKPYRRARLVEVDFGVVREYTGDKLISFKVIEEMDLLTSTVPSNEMQFVLDNSDQLFNILNPNGIYRYLVPNQEMTAQIGLLIGENKYEWIPMGKYFLTEWTVEEGAMTSTFVGRDIFTKLEAVDYTTLLQDTNLYDLAEDILIKSEVEKYQIDETLKLIPTKGFIEPIKVRQALQMIAIAGRCVVRQVRDGAIVIEHFEELTFDTGYITFAGQEFAGPTVRPQIYIDYQFQIIDFDTVFNAPKISLSQKVTHVIIKVHETAEIVTDVKFVNPGVIEGIGYEINNPLINTQEQASLIADFMFREYNLIADYTANWRQNPALECGNVILIEDSFSNKQKARITKQEYNFAGYLDGITEAKGGV
jgi:hypothetical protein